VYSSLLIAAQKQKGVKLLMVLMLGVRSPQSIACGVWRIRFQN
jgi:hypothetical protein